MRRWFAAALVWTIGLILVPAAPAEVKVWFAPSATKILRDSGGTAAPRQGDLAAARNETEACQLGLRSEQAESGVTVRASELRHSQGNAQLPVQLFKVAYVPNILGKKEFPDPLPPLTPLDLKPNQAQPVWISVKVPEDALPGQYTGTITVEAAGKTQEFPLRLRVWDFALPQTPSCATAFGLTRDHIARQHGVELNSPDAQRLYEAYYEALLEHRISANLIPVDLKSDRAAKYLNDPRMTSYQVPYLDKDEDLKELVAYLTEHGWYAKGFFYPIDEPEDKAAYENLARVDERLKRCLPHHYQWVVPFFSEPNWTTEQNALELLSDRVNLWCPLSLYLNRQPKAQAHLAARKAQGDRLWWYVCCIPVAPYNNFMIDMSAMSHRLLFWQQRREHIDGLLYWASTWWNPAIVEDPWTDVDTIKDIKAGSLGEGALFYPGKQVGVDGPVSSLRLEVIRDGLEDFDYLALADAWLGEKVTESYLKRLVLSLTFYEQDPQALEAVRRELGDALEKQRPKTATADTSRR